MVLVALSTPFVLLPWHRSYLVNRLLDRPPREHLAGLRMSKLPKLEVN